MADKTVYVQPVGDDRDTHYHTLAAAVSGEATDLTASGMLYICIRGDWSGGADTTMVDIDGYTTDSTHYIKIYTDSANRASTTWSTGKYRLAVDYNYIFYLRENYTWIDGIQLQQMYTAGAGAFFLNVSRTTGWIRVSNCVLKGNNSSNRMRITAVSSGAFNDITFWNCICYNWGTNGDTGFWAEDSGTVLKAYNCSFFWQAGPDIGVREDSGSMTLVNCYSGDADSYDYYGSITMTTCASSDTTGTLDNIALNTTNFTDVTIDGGEDWSLPAGSGLIDQGTSDPGAGLFSDDINGTARGYTWDIGAHEYATSVTTESLAGGPAAVSSLSPMIYRFRGPDPQDIAGTSTTSNNIPYTFHYQMANTAAGVSDLNNPDPETMNTFAANAIAGLSTFGNSLLYTFHHLITEVAAGVSSFGNSLLYTYHHMMLEAAAGVSSLIGNLEELTGEIIEYLAAAVEGLSTISNNIVYTFHHFTTEVAAGASTLWGNLQDLGSALRRFRVYMRIHGRAR